jgi:hypothetical protein
MDGGGDAVGKDEQSLVERLYGSIWVPERGVVQSQLLCNYYYFQRV